MNQKIKVEQRVHKMWEEWDKLSQEKKDKFAHKKGWVDKWQYIYSSPKGEISLIILLDYFKEGDTYEIYCVKGKLFTDTRRFDTKEEAEKFIEERLI